MKRSENVRISELNPHLMCVLCGGYYVDATTIIECLHSFCKACIVKYLDCSKFCPICDVQVHKTKPLLNIRPDHALQKLVYKLVPGLFTSEVIKRRQFYRKNPSADESASGSDGGQSTDGASVPVSSVVGEDTMSISLQLSVDGKAVPKRKSRRKGKNLPESQPLLQKRFLLCPVAFTIGHVKKFIRTKFDLSPTLQVDVFHVDEPLSDSYALLDITYIYSWSKNEPFPLFFSVFENAAKRQKCDEQIPVISNEPTPAIQPAEEPTTPTDVSLVQIPATASKSESPNKSVETSSPDIPAKAVKRKLEDELIAVDLESRIDKESVPDTPVEDVSAAHSDTVIDNDELSEDEPDQTDIFDELPEGQTNGCKISTSSSGKSIVVSIPKHLLETSGSEKEKKKKSKRRDSHHHHKHHRKHRRQSKDEKESSSKSKKRRESYEQYEQSISSRIDSSTSTSPASCRGGHDDHTRTSESTDVLSTPSVVECEKTDMDSKITEVGSEHIAFKSESETGEDATVNTCDKSETDQSTKQMNIPDKSVSIKTDSKKTVAFASDVDNKTKSSRDSSPSKRDLSPKRHIQREPVLHQLQQEWDKSQKKPESQDTPASDKPCHRESVDKVASEKSTKKSTPEKSGKSKSGESHRSKKSPTKQNDHVMTKSVPAVSEKAPSQKRESSPHKKQTSKQKEDQPAKHKPISNDEHRKLKVKKETSHKLSQRSEHIEPSAHKVHDGPSPKQKQDITSSKPHSPRKSISPEKEPSSSKVSIGKNKPVKDLSAKPQNQECDKLRFLTTQGLDNKPPKVHAKPADKKSDKLVSPKNNERHPHNHSKPRHHSTSNGTSISAQKSPPSMKGKTVSLKSFQDKLAKKTSSMSSASDIRNAKKHSIKSPDKKEARGEKRPSPSSKVSSPLSVVSQAVLVPKPPSPLYRAIPSMESETSSPKRPSLSPRLSVPVPLVRQERPDTLNVPIPWQSLTSLAEAGRKVQESANTALGRTSPCGSSARQLVPSWLDDRRNANAIQSPNRLPIDRPDNPINNSISPFSDHLSTFESPSVPKGIKTYSKKDKMTFKSPNPFTHSPFAYESAFKSFLNSPKDACVAPRKTMTSTTDSSGYVGSSLLGGHRTKMATAPVASTQRHIHGHKVIGQLNMVYETIQKPSYSEIYRKHPKQMSPNKAPTYIFDKDIDGGKKKSLFTVTEKGVPKVDVKHNEDLVKSPSETITNPSVSAPSHGPPVIQPTESQTQSPTSVNPTRPSQEKSMERPVQQPENRSGKEDTGSIESTETNKQELETKVTQPPATTRCESSFSATHLATSPPRYGHMCGASSPPEAMCLKCSPRPRSTSPHVASSTHRSSSAMSRPMLSPREYPMDRTHFNCPRSVHSTCATGGHSPQNNNLSAAASVDLALHCDQCQSASVSTRSDPNLYAKMAPQEVPLNLHKPRNRPDH